VQDLATSPADAAIAMASIAFARGLGLRVIAEGVETGEQLAILGRNGCDAIQGFLVSRPVPEPEIATLLAREGLAGRETPADPSGPARP
jgi:EAL domain-containing protein (putative c-di-GMP-specific phosphodiesterase class I)